jgi:hypothetical protein
LTRQTDEAGCVFDLELFNRTRQVESVRLSLDGSKQLPAGKSARLFDPLTGGWRDFGPSSSIEIPANGSAYRQLAVGTAEYLARAQKGFRTFKVALTGTFPNPFRRNLTIRYTVPYIGIDRVEFTLFDLSGRALWHRTVPIAAAYGACEVRWNGCTSAGRPVASGVFILRMNAFDLAGRTVKSFLRPLTHIP